MDHVDFKLKLDDEDDKKPIDEKEKFKKSNELKYKQTGELLCHDAMLMCDWNLPRTSLLLTEISYREWIFLSIIRDLYLLWTFSQVNQQRFM